MVPQTHHGICVDDIDAARAALASVGFTVIQPNAPEPLVYVDAPDDEVGQRTCPDLGSPYRTHFVENPATGHQIDLIEIAQPNLLDRPAQAPLSGDLTITMPIAGADLVAAAAALRPWFGDRLVVTDGGEPWATLHVAAADECAVRSFLTEVLGVELVPVGDQRWTMAGIGGRIDLCVSATTPPAPPDAGKRYVGANHLRLLHRDLAAVAGAAEQHDDVRWLLPPAGGFAFIAGPANLTIELFDRSIDEPLEDTRP